MRPTIELIVYPGGDLVIEAVGYKGRACDKATEFIEKALGRVLRRKRKPEYHQKALATQKVAGMEG